MNRARLCVVFAFAAALAAGCGDDKVKPPDRTYKTPSGDSDMKSGEKGTDEKEK